MTYTQKQRWTKRFLGVFVGVFLCAYIFMFSILPVFAVPGPGVPVFDAGAEGSRVTDRVELTIGEALLTSALQSLMNTAQFFIRKVSYDTAVYLASGGKGQGALIEQENFGAYLENTALDTAAEAIHQIGEPFGLNLCEFPDIKLKAFIQIGLRDLYGGGGQPNCSWQQLQKGWSKETFREKYGRGFRKLIPEKFSDVVSVKQSDLGVSFDAIAKIDRFTAGQEQVKALERTANEGFKSVKELISGRIVTPASVLQEEVKSLTATKETDRSNIAIAGIYGTETLNLIPYAAQIFLSTFASTLLKRAFSDGIVPPGGDFNPNAFGIYRSNREAAKNALTDFLGVTVGDVPEYDIVTKFSACPSNPKLDNCVMDIDLARAVARANIAGEALTIAEAIKEGLLHADWPLISPRREEDNTSMDCYKKGYCYSNIQKLRRARILPIGFEIAAFKADPSNLDNWTLGDVVSNFNNCTPPNDQYCHLIDPNWVIKSPVASCPSEVYGPNLVTGRSPSRSKECVDLATCVATDESGKCVSQGFCTKEKNVWRFVADSCKEEYATCRTYESDDGGAASYLSRTLDYGRCSLDNIGCRTYSLDQNAQGNWLPSNQVDLALKENVPGRNQILHLNAKISNYSCSTGDDGCTAFYAADRDGNKQVFQNAFGEYVLDKTEKPVYLKRAPDYLQCYDAQRSDPDIDWPTTLTQIRTDVSQDERCKDYAGVCISSEVGCESYTQPTDPTAPAIPGIIGANGCSASCLGYDTYKQVATSFEPAVFPLYFVPQEGRQCESQFVGCDEFTNLDERSDGGERLEYYTDIKYCEKPSPTNQKPFYSWEGSDDEGFVLKVHNLLPMTVTGTAYIVGTGATLNVVGPGGAVLSTEDPSIVFRPGSPTYADDSRVFIEESFRACNEAAYLLRIQDPTAATAAALDCRAMYDDAGDVYYRLLEDTVTISDSCRRLRKTNSSLSQDATLNTANACAAKSGFWGPLTPGGVDVCQRCSSGGKYASGTCVYNAIADDTESRACPASANLCRHYVGNTGRNVNTGVVADEFEGPSSSLAWGIGFDGAGNNPNELRVAAEAIVVGGNSLRIDAPVVARQMASSSLSYGASYELSFWARGATQNVTINFGQNRSARIPLTVDSTTGNPQSISIGDSWREYRVGPAELNLDFTQSNTIELIFERSGAAAGPYFVDHVRLTQLQDQIFLIEDTWKKDYNGDGQITDASNLCDVNPTDSFPGAALGCSQYKDTGGRTVYATGFEQLCREEAVGCQPLWNTFNSYSEDTGDEDATRMHAYNLGCIGRPGETCKIHVTFDATRTDEYTCQVGGGDTSCMIAQKVVIPDSPFQFPQDIGGPDSAAVLPATVLIPADTVSSTPQFLAAGINGKHLCKPEGLGCMQAAREELVLPDPADPNAYKFVPVFIKNDPALYTVDTGEGVVAGTLCQDDVVGCGSFQSGTDTTYFRDPEVTGQAFCQYNKGVVLANGTTINGWFYDNLGQCANGNLCRSDGDCGAGAACTGQNTVPCYPNFISRSALQGVVYGLHSNDSPAYTGLVGVCPEDQNLCTEFVDPTDISNKYPRGRSYFALKNQKIRDKERACEAGVSRIEGCILFNETSNPSRPFHSTSTYEVSAAANPPFRQVPPQSSPDVGKNDSNIILEVDRDRECAEWLSCRSAIIQVDDDGSKSELCYDYRACDAIKSDGSCANWVIQNELSLLPLTETRYAQRSVGWNDPDYAGYTIFNKRQINDYQYISFDLSVFQDAELDPDKKDEIKRLAESQYLVFPFRNADNECQSNGTDRDAFTSCAPGEQGRCIGGACYTPTEGRFPPFAELTTSSLMADPAENLKNLLGYLVGGNCKAYPEEDSPFPQKVLSEGVRDYLPSADEINAGNVTKNSIDGRSVSTRVLFGSKKRGFEQANVCQDGVDCSCKYNKISYSKGPTDYWVTENRIVGRDIGKGVCVGGGINEGRPCTKGTADSCGNGSTCQFLDRKETHVGLSGFCLERDLSRPINGASILGSDKQDYACLTWLPIEVSASTIDVFNTHLAAGYHPDIDALGAASTGPYGKMYCTNATKVGDGIYTPTEWRSPNPDPGTVTALTNQYFTPDFPVTNRGYFLPRTGKPRLGEDDRECSHIGVSGTIRNLVLTTDYPYMSLFCDPRSDGQNIYRAMKIWGWEMLGPNAEVLRIEKKSSSMKVGGSTLGERARNIINHHSSLLNTGVNYGDEYRGSDDNCRGNNANFDDGRIRDNCVLTHQTVYHLAPMPGKYDEGTLGVQMHAPRLFGDPASFFNPEYRRPDRTLVFTKTAAYTPETNLFAEEDFIARNQEVENTIRDTDISRVYFVPTHYPGGDEGAMPDLLTRTMYIDFVELKKAVSKSQVGAVEAHYNDDAFFSDGDVFTYPDKWTGVIGNNDNEYKISAASSRRWTYLIERNRTEGVGKETIGFNQTGPYAYDFDGNPDTQGGVYKGTKTLLQEQTVRRNKIARRYVLVWVTDIIDNQKVTFPSFVPKKGTAGNFEIEETLPGNSGQDVFSGTIDCKNSSGNNAENWIAIGMDFNEDGEFLGYISRWCNQTKVETANHDDNAVAFAVFATMKDRCTEMVQVQEDANIGAGGSEANKAWTNRVWEYAKNYTPVGSSDSVMRHPFAFAAPGRAALTVLKKESNMPFGALNITPEDARTDVQQVRNYSFRFPAAGPAGVSVAADGIPYACTQPEWFSLRTFGGRDTCNALSLEDVSAIDQTSYRQPLIDELNQRTKTFAYAAVHQLFAKFYSTVSSTGSFEFISRTLTPGRPSTQINSYIPLVSVNTTSVDISGPTSPGTPNFGDAGGLLKPPQVYSLNPANCKDSSRFGINKGCAAGDINNVTINDRNGTLKNYDRDAQNIIDEDTDSDGNVDPLIATTQFAATMQFFAFADDNRMPIRRVMVDWADGTQVVNQSRTGLYKNRKPYCSTTDSFLPDVGLCGTSPAAVDLSSITCKKHADCPLPEFASAPIRCYGSVGSDDQDSASSTYTFSKFGNARRACTAKPFIFTHDYTCTLQDVDPNNARSNSYRIAVGAVPNVQAREILINQYGLTANDFICMYRPRVQVLDNWGWCSALNPTTGLNEGLWNDSAQKLCDNILASSVAWIPYRGEIYVLPPSIN